MDLIELNKSMIRTGHYITGAYNEYYIPKKVAYRYFDFNHDYVIFGYDDNKMVFKSAAYLRDKTYNYFDIPYDDYLNAVTKNKINKTNVNYYRINSNYTPALDIKAIISKIEDYLYSRRNGNINTGGDVYGIKVWENFAKYVATVDSELDARYGRAYMKHHGLMLKRIQVLTKLGYVNNKIIEEGYRIIYSNTVCVHNLFTKFNLSHKPELLVKINNIINSLICEEKRLIALLVNNLIENIN